jgi:hypothetical protein
MALQTFTSGAVLTAAQVMALQANDYNQTVSTKTASYTLVAADVGTRVVMNNAGTTTITVNTSLFSAGDTLMIHNIGAGATTLTAGTATVNTANRGNLRIRQYGSGILFFTSASTAIWFAYDNVAMATGEGFGGAGATTVTFPSNRFAVTPRLLINNYDGLSLPQVSALSAASFTYSNAVFQNQSYSYIATEGAQ